MLVTFEIDNMVITLCGHSHGSPLPVFRGSFLQKQGLSERAGFTQAFEALRTYHQVIKDFHAE